MITAFHGAQAFLIGSRMSLGDEQNRGAMLSLGVVNLFLVYNYIQLSTSSSLFPAVITST
jgi:hypothetical protein